MKHHVMEPIDFNVRLDIPADDLVPIINAAGDQAVRVVHAIGLVVFISRWFR